MIGFKLHNKKKKLYKIYILLLTFISCLKAQTNSIHKEGWTVKTPFEQKNFIENAGQIDLSKEFPAHKILFEAYTEGIHYYLSNKGLILMKYFKVENTEEEIEAIVQSKGIKEKNGREEAELKYHIEKKYELIEFENANPSAEIVSGEKVNNYYTYSNPADKSGKTGIKAFAHKTVTYKSLYNNIDLIYEFLPDSTGIKYSFTLNPGANINDIKLIFPQHASLKTDGTGNLLMKSETGLFTHQAPKTFVKGTNKRIDCNYKISQNAVQFIIANYNNSNTLIIDPWIHTPPISATNYAFDVDFDEAGNVYAYGGDNPFKVVKYTSTGSLKWTHTTSFTGDGYYGDFAVDVNSESVYIVEGFNPSAGANVVKLNQSGSPVATYTGNPQFIEMWRIAFSRCTNKAVIAGGGISYPTYQTCNLDTTLNTLSMVQYISTSNCCHDISCLALDNYGSCYQVTNKRMDGIFDNQLVKLPLPSLLPITYNVSTGYDFIETKTNLFYTTGASGGVSGGEKSVGYNGITTSNTNVYTYDSYVLKKWKGANGNLLKFKRVDFPAGGDSSKVYWGGITSDDCDHIFLGDKNLVRQYDSSLNLIATYTMPDTVYDIKLGNNGNLYVCGGGFVTSFSVPVSGCNPINTTKSITNPTCHAMGSATLTVNSGMPPFTITWGTSPIQTGAVASNLPPGTYTVSITDNSCVKQTKIDTVIIPPAYGLFTSTPNSQNIICNGEKTGSIIISNTGGVSPFTYTWSTGQNGVGLNSLNNLAAGTYSVNISDSAGCKNIITVTITQPPPIKAVFTSGTIKCNGDTVSLSVTASNGHNPYTYLWNTSSTFPVIHGLNAGTYSISITDSLGCRQKANYTITQPAVLDASIVKSDCKAAGASYIKVNPFGGTQPYSYAWDINSPQTTDSIFNLNPGTYSVTVTDANKCTKSLSENIYLNFQELATVNIFTPNGDNRNDVFFPFEYGNSSISSLITSIDSYELFIYDRWGKLVFSTTEPANTWAGKELNGDACSDGVYYWVATINSKCQDTGKQSFKGFVHLER